MVEARVHPAFIAGSFPGHLARGTCFGKVNERASRDPWGGVTMQSRRHVKLILFASIVGLVAAGCSSNSDTSSTSAGGTGGLSGSVTISGSSTVLPISRLVAEQFAATNPDAQVTVDGPGTGDGFVLFCEGKTDINDASREIEPEEAKACKDAGINYVGLEVGLDGITVMTNPANSSVTCLNDGDLYALFGPESKGFDTWSDADALANEVDGTDSFPDAPLTIVAPGEESGTYDSFIELAGIEDTALSQGVAEDDAASLRPDYQSSPNDSVIIQGIEGSDSALGFVGFAYADQQGDAVKKLEVDGGDGCVEPSAETITDGTYPLSRSLFIYVNTDKVAGNDTLKAFVDYYLSDEGIQSVTAADYVAIPSERLERSRSTWSSSAGS
jgi:phosphate transport system substrate-binding protein